MRIFVGTYREGVYRVELDEGVGGLGEAVLVGAAVKPSFLAGHPVLPVLYAVHADPGEEGRGARGAVRAFRVWEHGGLCLLSERVVGGHAPCHLVVDGGGRWLLFANYHDGEAGVLALGEGGELGEVVCVRRRSGSGPHPERQRSSHVHSVNPDGAGRFVHVADLGTDELAAFRFRGGALERHDPPALRLAPGSGPRHLAFHPAEDVAYLIHELDSTIGVLGYAAEEGRFRVEQVVSTLPTGFPREENTAAEVAVHPSGRFVYGSNRGHDSIAVFAVGEGGRLAPAGHVSCGGRGPRHFAVDPGGRYLVAANQHTDTLAGFRIDPERGTLTPLEGGVEVPAPVCVRFWNDR